MDWVELLVSISGLLAIMVVLLLGTSDSERAHKKVYGENPPYDPKVHGERPKVT
jgi:hypothetical protein